jgi:hypothetical protein
MSTDHSNNFNNYFSSNKKLVKQKPQSTFTLSDLINFQNEMFKRLGLNCKDSSRENWNKRSNSELEIMFLKKK